MPNADPEQCPDAGIVTVEGFPHGLRCMRCEEKMPVGSSYCSVPFESDMSTIICPSCVVI